MRLLIIFIVVTTILTKVYAQTNTWNGNTDTDWHKPCNWSLNAVPTCSHSVIIPTGTANKPTITAVAHAGTLEVQGSISSTITIAGSGILDVATCSGSPTVNGGCCSPPSTPVAVYPLSNPSRASETCTYGYQVSSSGATSYTWSVSSGITLTSGQGTNTANISFPSGVLGTTQTITVYASNACGNSVGSYTFTINNIVEQPAVVSTTITGSIPNYVMVIDVISPGWGYTCNVYVNPDCTEGCRDIQTIGYLATGNYGSYGYNSDYAVCDPSPGGGATGVCASQD